jgi:hypothetical protein
VTESAGGGATEIENAASATLCVASLTVIRICASTPTLATPGLPESAPVAASKVAQVGLLSMAKISVAPLASAAVGRKLYAEPTATDWAGLPEIVGLVSIAPLALVAEIGAWLLPLLAVE